MHHFCKVILTMLFNWDPTIGYLDYGSLNSLITDLSDSPKRFKMQRLIEQAARITTGNCEDVMHVSLNVL